MITEYFKKLLYLLGKEKRKLPLIFFSFLILSLTDVIGLGLIGPFMSIILNNDLDPRIIKIFDFFGLNSERNFVISFTSIIIIIIFLIKSILIIGINWYIIRFSQYQRTRLTDELTEMYQNISFLKFINKNTSTYIYTVHTLSSLYVNILRISLKVISDILVSLSIILVVIFTNFELFILIVLVFGTFAFLYDYSFRGLISRYGVQANELGIKFHQNICESLFGLKEMRILGFMKHFRKKSIETCKMHNLVNEKRQVIMILPRQITEFIMISILIFFVLFKFNSTSLVSLIPTLTVFAFAALRILPIINSTSLGILNFRHDYDVLTRLYNDYNFIKDNYDVVDRSLAEKLDSFKKIELKNINFAFDKNKALLKNISITINKGEMIGIIGNSGSGKTTLIDIMVGLVSPSKGSILVNDKILNKKELSKFQNQISYIPQDLFLIDDTLKNNIAIGIHENDIDLNKIDEAIKLSKLDELVNKLPDGINSFIGEKGSKISGGQKQRIALARSIYHQRKILVMDEATSALDNMTEKGIIKSLNDFKGDKTIIMIAHRMSSLEYCDRIYSIENGRIRMFKEINGFHK